MMDVTNTENKEIFDQSATRLKGIKNLMTPSGDVMRVTDTDLKWFNHFYTFEVQGKKCYQSIPTIAKVMGRARSGAQERIDKLESLGLLTVGKETFKDGWRNTYTCTPIDVIVSRMTDAKVTPQDKKLKKSQLDSLLRKSEAVDALAINHGIKEMAKAIADLDLSDSEVMQFAFQISREISRAGLEYRNNR
jgi:predicted transcriptional regulator